MAISVLRISDETLVNTYTTKSQYDAVVTSLPDGGWLVTWTSQEQDGSQEGIYQQRYDKNGQALYATDVQVNATTQGNQAVSSVTVLADGGWLVTWRSASPDGLERDIYQQRYDANGVAQYATDRLVNVGTSGFQDNPVVTALPESSGGGWVVTWQSSALGAAGIFQRRYDRDGNPLPDPTSGTQIDTRVNAATDGSQQYASVTTLEDGGWLVTWTRVPKAGNPYDANVGIYMQRYDRNGVALFQEGGVAVDRPVAAGAGENHALSAVTALKGGGWVIAWQSNTADGNLTGIFLQQFDPSGAPVGSIRHVNQTTSNRQENPSITALADGGWIVTWESGLQDGSGLGVFQRRYAADGTALGPEMQVNAFTGQDQRRSSVSALADGNGWIVAWDSFGQDADKGSGIVQRVYRFAVDVLTPDTEIATGTAAAETLTVRKNGLSAGDRIDGGGGNDTLLMTEAGTLDLALPTILTDFETLRGSAGNDVVIATAGRLDPFRTIDGEGGDDELRLLGFQAAYDLWGKVSDIERISLIDSGISVTVSDLATALLVHGETGRDQAILLDWAGTLTLDDRLQMFRNGIDTIDHNNQSYTNGVPEFLNLAGDQSVVQAGGYGRLDVGGDALVAEDTGRFLSLAVRIVDPVAGQDRLGIAPASGVTIAGNTVIVNGTPIGTLVEDGTGANGLKFDFTAAATPDLVQDLIRALTFVSTASPGHAATRARHVTIDLVDGGGAKNSVGVIVEIDASGTGNQPPGLDLPAGDLRGFDTGLMSPFADVWVTDYDSEVTVTVTFDPGNGKLIVPAGSRGDYNAAAGTYTVSGAPNVVTAALQALQFDPRDRPGDAVGQAERTTFDIEVKDDGLGYATGTVAVVAVTADRPPEQLTFTGESVRELARDGAVIGTVKAVDPNAGDTLTYSLHGAGSAPFTLVGDELRVINGVAIDYEQKSSYTFTLRATDAGGLSVDKLVTIRVDDVNPETTAGTAQDDRIKGGAGKDVLRTGLGNDTIHGGAGNDTLSGQGGRDTFVFDTRPHKSSNVDRITDFKSSDDSFYLDNKYFTKLGSGSASKPKKVNSDMFVEGTRAKDKEDRIVYDKKSGALYYDKDGTGSSAQVKIATISNKTKLAYHDLFVI